MEQKPKSPESSISHDAIHQCLAWDPLCLLKHPCPSNSTLPIWSLSAQAATPRWHHRGLSPPMWQIPPSHRRHYCCDSLDRTSRTPPIRWREYLRIGGLRFLTLLLSHLGIGLFSGLAHSSSSMKDLGANYGWSVRGISPRNILSIRKPIKRWLYTVIARFWREK